MAVLKNVDGTELMLDCMCGCDEGIRFRLDKDADFTDWYVFMTYTNGAFYKEQRESVFDIFGKKLKKIWAIIRNKDYYYSEVTMTREDFKMFREWINSVEVEED